MKAMADADATAGVDSDDSSIITKAQAEKMIKEELTAANNIGTTDKKATVAAGVTADGKTTYAITKGYATVANTLSFNLHVGADADMTNKITAVSYTHLSGSAKDRERHDARRNGTV